MIHAFLILAHTEPKLLLKLVKSLDADNHRFYIHVDRRSMSLWNSYEISELSKAENVTIISQYKVNWGGFYMIRATLLLLELALKDSVDWFHLISGQDFPIRTNEQFDLFFEKTTAKGYFSFVPESQYPMIEENRMNIYYLNDIINLKKKNLFYKCISKMVISSQRYLRGCGVLIRKPINMKVYKGAQWFSADRNICEFFMDYCNLHSEYMRRFRMTSCCDEIFFHTLLMQSSFTSDIIKNDLRFIKWKEGASSPEWLTEVDYDDIISSEDFFCRKVSFSRSSRLINKLSQAQ